MPVERVRVVRPVADSLLAQLVEEAAGTRFVDEFRLVREAESIAMARGTLFFATMAMILVPWPCLVSPTASPLSCSREAAVDEAFAGIEFALLVQPFGQHPQGLIQLS